MFDEKDNSRRVSEYVTGSRIAPAPREAVVEAGSPLNIALHDIGTSRKEQSKALSTPVTVPADHRKWR